MGHADNAGMATTDAPPRLLGVDFTCAPRRAKPITAAWGRRAGGALRLEALAALPDFTAFEALLRTPGPWVGGFDMPFGLPRALVEQLGWPTEWLPLLRHYAGLSRDEIRARFAAYCAARPVGAKFAHRASDGPAGSSPSMKWVNPPVAFMLHAGVPRLIAAGASLPGLHEGDPQRVALEAYPGLLAREVLGRRSYKSDDRARQTPERLIARKDLLTALELGHTRLGLQLQLRQIQREALVQDAQGDRLDAVLCLLQAAWALQQHTSGHPCYGLPPFDPLEGWIAGA